MSKVPLLCERCMNRMLCANGLPSARLRRQSQAQGQAGPGTARAGTVYYLHLDSSLWQDWSHCCRVTAGKAEDHIDKAARHAVHDARQAGHSARRLNYEQTAKSQDAADEEGHGEEGNYPWAMCMPTCLYRRTMPP